ncbi:MAG: hypothetical protein M1828_006528 [Chrysothrix sp. TS-e1954]|nr:MAG: hypothetical protein M1828_006528 [Chrysothrix sp. TS-e1954]
MPPNPPPPPPQIRALLFDIGGVLVHSPLHGIRSFETRHNLPSGYINDAISSSAPNGSWHRLERGEIAMDDGFFAGFRDDLREVGRWRGYLRRGSEGKGEWEGEVPEIDTRALFEETMGVSRTVDGVMLEAVRRLRREADKGRWIVAALSNTMIYPDDHPYYEAHTHGPDGRRLDEGSRLGSSTGDGSGGGSGKSEIRSLFDVFISSAHVRMRKPEPRIYELALRWLNDAMRNEGKPELRAEEVLFLDDIGANLRPASELGMRTIKVGLGEGMNRKAVREMEEVVGMRLLEEEGVAGSKL